MGDGVLNGTGGSGLLPGRKWRSSWEEEAYFVWLGERRVFFLFLFANTSLFCYPLFIGILRTRVKC